MSKTKESQWEWYFAEGWNLENFRATAARLAGQNPLTEDEAFHELRRGIRKKDRGNEEAKAFILEEWNGAKRTARGLAREYFSDLLPPTEHNQKVEEHLEFLAIREEATALHKAAERAGSQTLAERMLRLSDLEKLPAPVPLIDGVLFKGTTAMLYAPPAAGKSLLAIDFSLRIASGTKWQGHRTAKGRVLYVAAEGLQGLPARIAAWQTAWQTKVPEKNFLIYPDAVDLASADTNELAAFVKDQAVDFIVLDTLARVAPGLEENSSTAMGVVVSAADKIRKARDGATVLLVHHAGKNGDLRGSSALLGGMDSVLRITGDADVLTLEATKHKDAPTGLIARLKIDKVLDSVVLNHASGTSLSEASALSGRVEEALGVFRAAFSETGATSAQWRDVLEDGGMPRKSAYTAINKLVERGLVVKDGTRYSLGLGLDLDPP